MKDWCPTATQQLIKCQKAFNDLQDKYKALLNFVETIADESVYETYENLNELNWEAHDVLKYIGELK